MSDRRIQMPWARRLGSRFAETAQPTTFDEGAESCWV